MDNKTASCSECQSDYFHEASKMQGLCPNCAHYLYGYRNCKHEFENGRCVHCYWNGNTSEYIQKIMHQ